MSDKKNYDTPFEEALARAYEATGADNPTELVGILGISRQAFYKAKAKLKMPRSWAKKIQEELGFNPDWIIEGQLPKRMADYHQDVGSIMYAMRNSCMDLLTDFGPRYGVTSKEYKLVSQIHVLVDELRSKLDNRAFTESTDIPKEERLKKYYRGQEGSDIRIKPGTKPSDEESKAPVTQLGIELQEIKSTLHQAGADEDEIKQTLMDYVRGGRTPLNDATGTDDDDSI